MVCTNDALYVIDQNYVRYYGRSFQQCLELCNKDPKCVEIYYNRATHNCDIDYAPCQQGTPDSSSSITLVTKLNNC